jgi:hypothetical protein
MEQKMVRRRRNLFRVSTLIKGASFIKHILTCLRNNKAHKPIYKGVKIMHIADDNKQRGKERIIEGIK